MSRTRRAKRPAGPRRKVQIKHLGDEGARWVDERLKQARREFLMREA